MGVFVLGASSTFCAMPRSQVPEGAPPGHSSLAALARPDDDASGGSDAPMSSTQHDKSPRATAVDPRDLGGVEPFDRDVAVDPKWAAVDAAVSATIAAGKLGGCVVVIGTRDEILLKRAYGLKEVEPARVPMTLDTVFDLASLTKPVATGSSVMVLASRGAVNLDAPAVTYVPDLALGGRNAVTVRQLLLHTGGFRPDNPLSDFAQGPVAAWHKIYSAPSRTPPGEKWVYSDVGFMVLGDLVRRVSGKDLASFARDNVFLLLGMTETTFLPTPALKARAAPTEKRDGAWIRGDVHDPRAFALGGVAGHAGLFSTARDLSVFAQAWLRRGAARDGTRVVSEDGFAAFTAPHDVPSAIRALSWDMMSPQTHNRGEGLGIHAYGHGGFTGTSLWMEPDAQYFVLFLSNRVHPNGKGEAQELQARIGAIAAQNLAKPEMAVEGSCDSFGDAKRNDVRTGIDVLKDEHFASLRGRKIALLTNGSAKTRDGTRTLDAIFHADGVTLVRAFTPEHGLGADREGTIADGRDAATGVPLVSLYGANLSPSKDSLSDIDTLVVDLPDVGARFYTYASTMHHAMKAAAEAHVRFMILDRPNPINGADVAGPLAEIASIGLVHHASIPIRHGMTMGELARLLDAEEHLGTRLEIIRARGWRRADYLDATGLSWSPPSPNLRSLTEAVLYPGVAILEGTNVSVGRGTGSPFEVVGAPYIDGALLAAALSKRNVPGATFTAISFTPDASAFHAEKCGGIRITITDRTQLDPVRVGIALALSLRALYPQTWHAADVNRLLANRAATDALMGSTLTTTTADVEATWQHDLASFRAKRGEVPALPQRVRSTCARRSEDVTLIRVPTSHE